MVVNKLMGEFPRFKSILSNYFRLFITEKKTLMERGIRTSSNEKLVEDIQCCNNIWKTVGNELSIPSMPKFEDKIRNMIEGHIEYPNPRLELFLSSYRFLEKYRELENERIDRRPCILAVCMEMMVKSFMLLHDSLHSFNCEQNLKIWFATESCNLENITLSIILETEVQKLILQSYHEHKNFHLLNKILHDTKLKLLTWKLCSYTDETMKSFNEKTFDGPIVNGVSFQNFEMPVVLASLLAEVSEDMFITEYGRKIFGLLGKIYQIRKDFEDFELGELGYDIEDNKCTWLITQALKQSSPTQRKILEECYGLDSVEKASKVRQIYQNLNIHLQYPIVEREIYEKVQDELKSLPAGSAYDLMNAIVDNCFTRKE